MVNLHTPECTITKEGILPVMPRHHLKVIKETSNFIEGTTLIVFIAKYDNGRYGVMTASYMGPTEHYKVFQSADELHEHFEEVP